MTNSKGHADRCYKAEEPVKMSPCAMIVLSTGLAVMCPTMSWLLVETLVGSMTDCVWESVPKESITAVRTSGSCVEFASLAAFPEAWQWSHGNDVITSLPGTASLEQKGNNAPTICLLFIRSNVLCKQETVIHGIFARDMSANVSVKPTWWRQGSRLLW